MIFSDPHELCNGNYFHQKNFHGRTKILSSSLKNPGEGKRRGLITRSDTKCTFFILKSQSLKVFCRLGLSIGIVALRTFPSWTIFGVNRNEKAFLRCNFKKADTHEFSIFFAQNFKSDTSNTMFEIFGSSAHTRWGGVPASLTYVQLFCAIDQK